MSQQGTHSLEVGSGGGKFLGHRRSPLQGDMAWTRIRCSSELGRAVGTGSSVRMRVSDDVSGWRSARVEHGIDMARSGVASIQRWERKRLYKRDEVLSNKARKLPL